MKIAVVGCGVIGSVYIRVLNDLGFQVGALCDTDKSKTDKFDCKYKYTDYVRMLDDYKPDVVHICTPHYLHADMVIEALTRDVNVLCEKPLCIKYDDIHKITEAEKKSRAQLGVCHQNRFNKENIFVKDYLKDKRVVSAHGEMIWHRDEEYYNSSPWRGKKQTEGGGVLINQALHTLDLLQWFSGMPEKVKSSLSNITLKGIIEVEDTANLICSDGANFTLFATNGSSCTFPVNITIKTENENILISNGKVIINDKLITFNNDQGYGKKCYGGGHFSLISTFYNCIKTQTKFSIDGEEASKVVKIILKAYENQNLK